MEQFGWIALSFVILLLLPFLPGIIETILKKDIKSLTINQNFFKDPGYFGKSFKSLIKNALDNSKPLAGNTLKVRFPSDKWEKILICSDKINTGKYDRIIIFAEAENVTLEGNGLLESNYEIYVKNNFLINKPFFARALYVGKNLTIFAPFRITRWAHVEGSCNILDNSNLGISFYSAEQLQIKAPCSFKRIFASEIMINKGEEEQAFQSDPTYMEGTIKPKGKIDIEIENSKLIIDRNILSDDEIIIKGKFWIKGNLFSNKNILLTGAGGIVGEKGKIKTLYAKKEIKLIGNFKVYGYIYTDGIGHIV
ncbi:MAG: hypothetical protein N3A59_08645 [Thermodesulfovibrionales bacterium]|nr:hypothetical protein [Thermodesulfovibrionales bacterium]